jgi:hypothetical protein
MYRWAACPGSVKLSAGIKSESSIYAQEGSRAHEALAAMLLEEANGPKLDEESAEAVLSAYVAIAQEVGDIKQALQEKRLFVEHRFALKHIREHMFGTADCVIWKPEERLLQVWDYKHGAGIYVSAESNQQLLYYALGVLSELKLPAKEVELVIVQPRAENGTEPRRWRFHVMDIVDFEAELVKAVERTEQENAPLISGEHCRFCPAAGICPQLRDEAMEVAKSEFEPVVQPVTEVLRAYSPEKLADVLDKLPKIEAFVKAVREFAYLEACAGKEVPGYKLVEKRATRKWKDEQTVLELVQRVGRDDLVDVSVKSVAQIEKLLGKKELEKQLGAFIVAESSGLTLVHESDKRTAVQIAKDDFAAIPEGLNTLLE